MESILSLSYGKDSTACLWAIQELGWPLDRIVTAASERNISRIMETDVKMG